MDSPRLHILFVGFPFPVWICTDHSVSRDFLLRTLQLRRSSDHRTYGCRSSRPLTYLWASDRLDMQHSCPLFPFLTPLRSKISDKAEYYGEGTCQQTTSCTTSGFSVAKILPQRPRQRAMQRDRDLQHRHLHQYCGHVLGELRCRRQSGSEPCRGE